jgi:hypothetical protein
MFDRLSRSWQLVKASGAVLLQDRKLLLFPLISGVATLLVVASFALPVFGVLVFDRYGGHGPRISGMPFYLIGFLFYLVQYFVIFFFNSALVGAAMMHLDGRQPTLGDGLRLAGSKFGAILGYAFIAATVGLLLRMLQERVGFIGRLVVGLLGVGWNIATFLVVPVLVARDVGPLDAVKESAATLKRTWGENVVGQAGLGLAFGLLQLAVVCAGVLLVAAAAMAGSVALVVLALTFAVLSVLVHSALSGIYAAALYRFAVQGSSAQGFDAGALRQAFVAR